MIGHKKGYIEQVENLAKLCKANPTFSEEVYREKQVKRGLRDIDGTGVIAGLTDISDVIAKKVVDGEKVPCPGELYYRGIDVQKMIDKDFLKNAYINENTREVVLPSAAPANVNVAQPTGGVAPAAVQTRVIACPCCGANNTISGDIGECEYCGTLLK